MYGLARDNERVGSVK